MGCPELIGSTRDCSKRRRWPSRPVMPGRRSSVAGTTAALPRVEPLRASMRTEEDAMTETDAGQPPSLGLGDDGDRVRQALRTIAENERHRRYERGRAARSDDTAAARDHD